MFRVRDNEPSRLIIEAPNDLEKIKAFLTYRSKPAELAYSRFRHASWYANKYGNDAFRDELQRLQSEIKKCLVFEEPGKDPYTYAGLLGHLRVQFSQHDSLSEVVYPVPTPIPWANKLEGEDRDFQQMSLKRLLYEKHASVEVATGLGKTRIIIRLCQQLGLKTVVMTPSVSIAANMYQQMRYAFGDKYVGMYGDGKKIYKKRITVGIHASLAKLEPGDPAWDELSKADVFIVDESHMTPAATLEKVCMGVCRTARYRFFFSATQIRSDGAELVLKGITGPIVYTKDFAEGVNDGFLAKPHFKMVRVASNRSFESKDANEMTRVHLYYNSEVAKKAGQIADAANARLGHQVLILIQEVEQFGMLLPHIHVDVGFAHGGLTKENKTKVPAQYHDSDPIELVKRFNKGQLPILVGTSCIATGTDILPPKTGIYLMGQSSEVKTKQALGRMTRRPEGKSDFHWFDFLVTTPYDDPTDPSTWRAPFRHGKIREGFYRDMWPDVSIV